MTPVEQKYIIEYGKFVAAGKPSKQLSLFSIESARKEVSSSELLTAAKTYATKVTSGITDNNK